MAVVRWDPWGELAALQRDVNQLVTRGAPSSRTGALVPPIDAFQTEEGLVVRVELPGMAPDSVDVSVNNGVLSISGERKAETDIADDAWLRRERPVGSFERSFSLPEGTDAQQIRASFDLGVLELQIPHPPQRRPHKVQINAGDSTTTTVDVES